MANKKKHLTKEERFLIEKCLAAGDSLRSIAQRLGRGVSTVSEEVVRCGGREKYDAQRARHRAYLRQWRKKRSCKKVALDSFLARFVEEKLRAHWSPERIAGYLRRTHRPYASPKAIRKFARSRRLESYLYRRGKRKQTSPIPIRWEYERVFVDDPRCVREGYGHWEGDFIVSSKSTAVLLVLVERMTKDTVIRWLPHRNNTLVRKTIAQALMPKTVCSLTVDNDVAFIQHPQLSEALRAPVYFARPFRSTDKPLVENTNRWIRWFVPKKTDIATVSYEKVLWLEEWFGSVPRQCLEFATSREMVRLQVLQAGGCSY
jgi:IS30 family transposase